MAQQEQLIETIYQASYQPERWMEVMATLTLLTRAKSAALFIQDKELKQVSGFFPSGASKAAVALYRTVGVHLDPGFKRMREVPVGVARAIIDLSNPDGELGIYEQLLLRPTGVHAVLGLKLIDSELLHAGIGIHRSREQGSFDKATCALVEALAPHFTRAITLYREFARIEAQRQAMQAGLEYLSIGTVLYDHLARPVYLNPRARYLFENHPATRLNGDLPIVVDRTMAQRLHNAVIGALEGESEEMTLGLFHPDASSPLVVRIVSVRERGELPSKLPSLARCVMYVTDPEHASSIPPAALQQIYGLTTVESRVAVGLANGYTVEEIAALHKVQAGTVRVQLRAIFQKVGVSRQSDLVRTILSIPALWNTPIG